MPYGAYVFRRPAHRIPAQRWLPGIAPVTARDFDGSSFIGVSLGSVNVSGAHTLLGLVRITSLAAGRAAFSVNTSSGNILAGIETAATTGLLRSRGGTVQTAPTLALGLNKWAIAGYGHPAGTSTPRFHLYQDGVWAHEDAGGTSTHGTGDHLRIGSGESAGATAVPWIGQVAVVGFWNSFLNDTQVETLEDNWRSQDFWDAATAAALWELDQPDTSTVVLDQSGNGANQTSITGTSVVTSGPSNWTYHITTGTLGSTRNTNSARWADGIGAQSNSTDFNGTPLGQTPNTAPYPY